MTIILWAVAILFAGLRASGDTSLMFQGCAHIFVGIMFGLWIARRENWRLGIIGVALTVVEIYFGVIKKLL